MMMTIKQLAENCKVSKTAIRKYLTEDFRSRYTKINEQKVILIDEIGCKLIAESLRKPQQTPENTTPQTTENQVFADIIATLKAELEIKNKQIEDLSSALALAQQSVAQAQALHAVSVQKQLPPKKRFLNLFKKRSDNNG